MFLYRFILLILIAFVSFSATAQKNKKDSDKKDIRKREFKGITYQFHPAVSVTDSSILELSMKIFNSGDSLLRNTYEEDFPLILDLRDSATRQVPIVELMMKNGKVGDSLTLLIHSDSVFQNGQIRPIFIPEGSSLRHEIRILKNYSAQQYAAKLEDMQQKYMQEMAKKQQIEQQKTQMDTQAKVQAQIDYLENTYFKEKGITNYKKTSTGLYYVIEKQGTPIEKGQTIKVNYEGKMLSGEKFDSSFDRGEPIEFPIGVGQVIQGWDEGIPLIGKGGKGTLYIPSHLGYGERGAGGVIKPNSTLVFRVEVVD